MAGYIGISILRSAHGRLQTLARSKGVSMAQYVAQMVQFFQKTGRDPEDLVPISGSDELMKVKKGVEQVKRILKAQEQKLLDPMAQAVFGLEQSVAGRSTSSLLDELPCPRCTSESWKSTKGQLSCQQCSLVVPLSAGQYVFTPVDLAALLSLGMTRWFQDISDAGNKATSGRFYIDPQDGYTFKILQHDYRYSQPSG